MWYGREEDLIPDYEEIQDGPPPNKRKPKGKRLQASQSCPLCGRIVDKLRRRVLLKHLPFFVVPQFLDAILIPLIVEAWTVGLIL